MITTDVARYSFGRMALHLQIKEHRKGNLGVRATVAVVGDDGLELYVDEVRLWQGNSRDAFVKRAIAAANGNLTDLQRAAMRREWDQWLREEEGRLKAQQQAPQTPAASNSVSTVTDEGRQKSIELLNDPALLFNVLSTIKRLGIVGEEKNLLTLYLVMTSRLLPKPLSSATKGESSTGKSALDETIRRFFPEDETFYYWSAMSKSVLVYSDRDYEHKMLIFAESVGSDQADFFIRTILSENRLVFEVTEKDARSGQYGTRTIRKKGPTGFVTTTTLPKLHPENETRLITLAMDESEEQTKAIKESAAAEFEDEREAIDFVPWLNAQRLLEPVAVRIPFARYLLSKLPDKPIRMRRDCRKLLNFISASAALHQFQRQKTDKGEVIANLADYLNAKVLFEDIFFQSLYGTHPNTQTLMDAIVALGSKPGGEITTRELMDQLGWTKSKISTWAKPLHDYGWVTTQGPGKENLYHVGRQITGQHHPLPSIEEMSNKFPHCLANATIIHPITGEKTVGGGVSTVLLAS